MKGDASTRVTNQKYRAGYDAIDWSKAGDIDDEDYAAMERKLFGQGDAAPRRPR